MRFLNGSRLPVSVGVAAAGVCVLAGCALPTASAPPSPGESGSPSPTSNYTAGDAAALVAAATLALGAPNGVENPDMASGFIDAVKRTSESPADPQVDTGYRNAEIVEWSISPKGSADPVCVAVRSPTLSGLVPGQGTWVAYASPPLQGDQQRLFFTGEGVQSCADAATAVAKFQKDLGARQQANVKSQQLLQSAFLALPVSDLTPNGSALFDTLRGESRQQVQPSAQQPQPSQPSVPPVAASTLPPDFRFPDDPVPSTPAPPPAPAPSP